jgi:hypothetical protein
VIRRIDVYQSGNSRLLMTVLAVTGLPLIAQMRSARPLVAAAAAPIALARSVQLQA